MPSPPVSPSSEGRERGIMECGSEASAHAEANASALQTGQRTVPLSHAVGKGDKADKGTSVRHRIAAARAIFPSASVNGWARRVALTPFVPLSREAGEGDYGVRKRSFRPR